MFEHSPTGNAVGEADMTNTAHGSDGSGNGAGKKRSPEQGRPPSAVEILRLARAQFAELTGTQPESVSSFERAEDGWVVRVEVLELARVPDTMSLLATYEVMLGPDGELTTYKRVRRYERGKADPT